MKTATALSHILPEHTWANSASSSAVTIAFKVQWEKNNPELVV